MDIDLQDDMAPRVDHDVSGMSVEEMGGRAAEAAALLKALSHEGRQMILCHLSSGEKSVTEHAPPRRLSAPQYTRYAGYSPPSGQSKRP